MHNRLLWSLLLTALALNAVYGAVAGVLVPAQIARADAANKDVILGIVLTGSSLLTLVVHPVAGAASDRTRTRWGRRAPWIVGGAITSAAAMVTLGSAEAVWAVALGWLVLQPLLNVLEAPLDAVLADRVELGQRPRAAAFFGMGAAGGVAVGAAVAGLGVSEPDIIYTALAVALLVASLVFVVANPDRSEASWAGRMPARRAWAAPDLRRVFVARFALVLGHQLVMGYLLYIVMDFTGESVDAAGRTVTLIIAVHIVSLVGGSVAGALWIHRRVPWVVTASAVLAVALLIPLAAPNVAGLLAFAVVGGAARGVYLAADLALMIDVLPSHGDSGRDLGMLGLATIIPQALAPAVAGLVLVLSSGCYLVLFPLAAFAALTSTAVIARVGSPVRRP
ncbi:MFS transporter [Microbacterium sp. 179-B 1A2 NHS]|uniref:MFS transporter n=1 Tax=Microbacterium sp. 179-B 1A2 NHS TaxID=3142383 RepID=UPI0039A34E99